MDAVCLQRLCLFCLSLPSHVKKTDWSGGRLTGGSTGVPAGCGDGRGPNRMQRQDAAKEEVEEEEEVMD